MFLLLSAEFVAAAQVIVYAGAVMVLYVFVVAYVGGLDDELLRAERARQARSAPLLRRRRCSSSSAIAIIGSGLKAIDIAGRQARHRASARPAQIGELLLHEVPASPFEAASFLLLVAAVGAVVLAQRGAGPRARATRTEWG